MMFGSTWARYGSALTIFLIVCFCLYFSPARPLAYLAMSTTTVALGLVALILIPLAVVVLYFGPAGWVIRDAQQRGRIGPAVTVVVLFLSPLSALVWLLIRPRTRIVDHTPGDYTDAEEALSDAARLDQLGEWDAALAIYEHVTENWPEHQAYVVACVKQIQQKQGLVSPED